MFNEWHGEFLQLLGNTNYHSSDDDTFSCDTEREHEDVVSESVDSLTSESELSLPSREEQPSRPHVHTLPLPDDDPSSDESAILTDDDSDEDVSDDSDSNREPRQTRQTFARVPQISPRARIEPVEPVPPISLRNDIFSRFSDSNDSDDSFHPSATRHPNGSTRQPVERSSSESSNSDSDVDERDGRRSRVSHNQSDPVFSSSSHSSDSSENSASEPMASLSNDSSDDDRSIAESSPRQQASRRRVRWDSENSEDDEAHIPKRRRIETRPTSRAVERASRPRRQAAPVDLAEFSFNFEDGFEEARRSTCRHRNPPASSSRSARVQDRPSSSSTSRGNRNRSVVDRGVSTAASRRLAPGSSASSARPSSSSGASRRATAGSASARPSSSSGASRRTTAAGSSKGRRSGGSARTSGKRKKKGTTRKKSGSASKKRKTSVKVSASLDES